MLKSWQNIDVSIKNCIFATLKTMVMEEKDILARNIKRLRVANDFTQEKVADFLGIGRSDYANYEAGTREIPIDIIERLADLFGCDTYLLYEDNEVAVNEMLTTAFRVDNATPEDMAAIADFKRMVKNYLMIDRKLAK